MLFTRATRLSLVLLKTCRCPRLAIGGQNREAFRAAQRISTLTPSACTQLIHSVTSLKSVLLIFSSEFESTALRGAG